MAYIDHQIQILLVMTLNKMTMLYISRYPLIVYQMGRLCGGAHEISGIKAQIFLCGWVGVVGQVVVGRGGVVEWVVVVGWWVGVGVVGWMAMGWGR